MKNKKDPGTKFYKELLKRRKRFTKILKPRACYTKDYDIFNLNWGQRQIDSTIETNLLGNNGDCRFDVTKDGTIVGIEIDNFSEVLNKFNCDKRKRKKKRKSHARR